MEILDYENMTKSRYTDQFDNDKVFDAVVQTMVDYKMKVQGLYLGFAETILDLDKSTGKNLDLIGRIVGQKRVLFDYYTNKFFGFEGNPKSEPFDEGMWFSLFSDSGGDSRILSDEEYRKTIKARIKRNNTNCTRGDFIEVLYLLIGNMDFEIDIPSHGNIDLTLPIDFDNDFVIYFLSRVDEMDSIIPKPLGYKLNVKIGSI